MQCTQHVEHEALIIAKKRLGCPSRKPEKLIASQKTPNFSAPIATETSSALTDLSFNSGYIPLETDSPLSPEFANVHPSIPLRSRPRTDSRAAPCSGPLRPRHPRRQGRR